MFLLFKTKQQEDVIETIFTDKPHFARCTNSKCGAYFLIYPGELTGETNLLCPKCRVQMDKAHVVQCSNCHAVVDFIPTEPGEGQIVFNVSKCSKCSGTLEDEKQAVPYFFETFI